MVRIRFRRMGLKGQPTYRIVVTDKRKARGGDSIEVIGHHNPRTQPSTDMLDEARALYWLSVGAQPSDAVRKLMDRTGTWARFERLRKGEELEALVAEAEKEQESKMPVSPRTNYPAPAPGKGKGPRSVERASAASAPAAVAEAEEVAEEEAEAAE